MIKLIFRKIGTYLSIGLPGMIAWLLVANALVAQENGTNVEAWERPLPTPNGCSLFGRVQEEIDSGGIPYATIEVRGKDIGTYSDETGGFTLAGLDSGAVRLWVTCIGFESQEVGPIYLKAGQPQEVQIWLVPAAQLSSEVVVTAASRPQTARLAAASVSVVDRFQLDQRNAVTFDQAFDGVPGVMVTRSSGANVQALSIRGASEVAGGGVGNRVLLLIDGRPAISPESGGALWNLAPLGSVERIEVVKGAYSSLYGSSAMGGVVNIITRQPGEKAENQLRTQYGFFEPKPGITGRAGWRDFHSLEFSHSNQMGNLGYVIDGSWKHNDGHREKSAFDLYNFFGKAIWKFASNRQLRFSANVNHILNDAPSTWLSASRPYEVADYKKDDFQNRKEHNFDLGYEAYPSRQVKYSTRFYNYQNDSRYVFDGDPGNDSTNLNTGKQIIEKSGIWARRWGNITQVDWYAGGKHYLIAGLDVKWDQVNGVPDTFLYGRQEAFNAGVFAQDEITLNSVITATVGLRLDHYQVSQTFRETNLSPKIAAIYRPDSRLSFRMLLAQAFRNPAIAERFIKFEQGGGLRFQPNPQLKAERLKLSAELGGNLLFDSGSSLDVALFYNRYNNLISFQQISQPLQPLLYKVINLKKAVMRGVELSFSHRWSDALHMQIAYTFLDARDISPERLNDNLPYKVRHTLNLFAVARTGAFQLNMNARYRSAVREVFIYPGSEPGSAFILSGKMDYVLNENVRFFVAVDNGTDFQYEELERYRMPGRNYSTGLSFRF